MKNRRSFLKKTLAGASFLAAPQFAHSASTNGMQIALKGSFMHQVYFWLKHPEKLADCKRFEEGLQLLVTIPEIKLYHWGKAVPSNRDVVDDSFSYSYLAVFDSPTDQETYQTHPTHLKFIEEYGDLWEKVVVYDAL